MILGIDPGSRWIGWAVIGCDGFIAGGVHDLEALGVAGVVSRVRAFFSGCGCHEVGIETVTAVGWRPGFGPRMAGDLVRAARLGGRLAQALEDDGVRVHEITAEAWHLHFFGRTSADAKAVRALVEQQLGWPKTLPGVRASEAGHARDAGGVALAVRAGLGVSP